MSRQMLTDVLYIQPTIEESSGNVVKFKGVFQRADVINENKRVYPRKVLEKAINEFSQKVKTGRAVGTLEHPVDGRTKAYEISHKITNIYMNENGEVIGEAIALDTTKGKELKALLEGGVAIGISSRGFGTVKTVNKDGQSIYEVQDDFELETFDVVYDPSTPGAFVGMTESKQGEGNMDLEKLKQEYKEKLKALEESKNQEMREKLEDFAKKLLRGIEEARKINIKEAEENFEKWMDKTIKNRNQIEMGEDFDEDIIPTDYKKIRPLTYKVYGYGAITDKEYVLWVDVIGDDGSFKVESIEELDESTQVKALLAVEAITKILKPIIPELSEMKQSEAEVALEETKEKLKQLEQKVAELELEKYKLEKIAESHEPEKLKQVLQECKTKDEVDEKLQEFKKRQVLQDSQKTPIDEASIRRRKIFYRLAGKTTILGGDK